MSKEKIEHKQQEQNKNISKSVTQKIEKLALSIKGEDDHNQKEVDRLCEEVLAIKRGLSKGPTIGEAITNVFRLGLESSKKELNQNSAKFKFLVLLEDVYETLENLFAKNEAHSEIINAYNQGIIDIYSEAAASQNAAPLSLLIGELYGDILPSAEE